MLIFSHNDRKEKNAYISINSYWIAHHHQSARPSIKKVQFTQNMQNIENTEPIQLLHLNPSCGGNNTSTIKKQKTTDHTSSFDLVKENLQLKAHKRTTRIAKWNINNGFDHLAIATIMAKKDIDILGLQEPRLSNSTKDDVWIATMRKELRKCKYEIITSQFLYLIFDEQTSGAALASILRKTEKVQGRLLSVTFKTGDIWEAHTVISIYAVTNPKSIKKYANSRNSRKDINNKLTKALLEEITYLHEKYEEAPITIVGDYQDTIHDNYKDNIGLIGKRMNPDGPLQALINEGFISAYHKLHPNLQQVTRWNNSKTAGRHIDLRTFSMYLYSRVKQRVLTTDTSRSNTHVDGGSN